jgi:hypothetical protein
MTGTHTAVFLEAPNNSIAGVVFAVPVHAGVVCEDVTKRAFDGNRLLLVLDCVGLLVILHDRFL